jgi:hypothetical protein
MSLSSKREVIVEPKTDLTGSDGEGAARRSEIEAVLAEAGLELWQAPEGFWAIRVRRASVAVSSRSRRRRTSRAA